MTGNKDMISLLACIFLMCLMTFWGTVSLGFAQEAVKAVDRSTTEKGSSQIVLVAVGGLISLVSSIGVGFLLFSLQSRKERKVLSRSKLEELMALAYQCDDWLDQLTLGYLVQGDISAVLDKFPVNRMKMLQILYFPSLKDSLDILIARVKESRKFVILERNNLSKTHCYSEEFREVFDRNRAMVLSAIEDLTQQASDLRI
ncbi:MAG: hypothetical protein NT140_10680 [Deltaproteobacteria bacterium]|nr:hypothetical protein [Deltaproteobacteria bacterium]